MMMRIFFIYFTWPQPSSVWVRHIPGQSTDACYFLAAFLTFAFGNFTAPGTLTFNLPSSAGYDLRLLDTPGSEV